MALRTVVNKMLASTQVELKKASHVVPNVLKHVGTCDVEEGCDKSSIMNHDGILPVEISCVTMVYSMLPTLIDTMAHKDVCLCAQAVHVVRTVCTRSHMLR